MDAAAGERAAERAERGVLGAELREEGGDDSPLLLRFSVVVFLAVVVVIAERLAVLRLPLAGE